MSTFVYVGQVGGQANVYVDKTSYKVIVKLGGCKIFQYFQFYQYKYLRIKQTLLHIQKATSKTLWFLQGTKNCIRITLDAHKTFHLSNGILTPS